MGRSYSDRTLLLVYPPPSHPMGREALVASSADTCVFVGEYNATITGDGDFYAELELDKIDRGVTIDAIRHS